jgi:hypothetical protein
VKTASAISIAALLVALAVAPSAAGSDVSTSTTSDGVRALNLNALLRLIDKSTYDDGSLGAWTTASRASVIRLGNTLDADARAAIDAAVRANLGDRADLQAAISANSEFAAWLKSNGIDASSVIAIDIASDGSVDVYEG